MPDENGQPQEVTIEEALNHVKTWMDNGEIEKAKRGLNEIIEYAPNNKEAKDLLASLETSATEEIQNIEEAVPAPEEAPEKPSMAGEVTSGEPFIMEVPQITEEIQTEEFTNPEPIIEKPPHIFQTETETEESSREQQSEKTEEPLKTEPESTKFHEPEESIPNPEADLPGIEKLESQEVETLTTKTPASNKKLFLIVIGFIVTAILIVGSYFAYTAFFSDRENSNMAIETPSETQDSESGTKDSPIPSEAEIEALLTQPKIEPKQETEVIDELDEFVKMFEEKNPAGSPKVKR